METPVHNLVDYVDPVAYQLRIGHLETDPEKALAQNAVWWFIEGNTQFRDSEKKRLAMAYRRYGNGMFIWKYYLAARNYIGGYKALSAHLMLRRSP